MLFLLSKALRRGTLIIVSRHIICGALPENTAISVIFATFLPSTEAFQATETIEWKEARWCPRGRFYSVNSGTKSEWTVNERHDWRREPKCGNARHDPKKQVVCRYLHTMTAGNRGNRSWVKDEWGTAGSSAAVVIFRDLLPYSFDGSAMNGCTWTSDGIETRDRRWMDRDGRRDRSHFGFDERGPGEWFRS